MKAREMDMISNGAIRMVLRASHSPDEKSLITEYLSCSCCVHLRQADFQDRDCSHWN